MSRDKKKKRPRLAREGFVGRLHYFTERALLNIRQNVLVNLITVGTISLAFLILSLFLLIYVNLERVTETWSERVQVTVYFDRELTSGEVASFSVKDTCCRRRFGSSTTSPGTKQCEGLPSG